MIMGEDKERDVKLLESEIQEIIRCIEDVPYGVFTFMRYDKIIKKLKKYLKEDKKKNGRKQKV